MEMLPEVVLETSAKKKKKPFGETYVGGLFQDLIQGFASGGIQQIGTPSSTPIQTPNRQNAAPIIIQTPQVQPEQKVNDNSTKYIIAGVVGVGLLGLGFFLMKPKRENKKPLNGTRGLKKKRGSKKETINL